MLRRAICSGQWKSFKLDLASDQFRVDREPRTRFTVTDSLQKGGKGGNKTEEEKGRGKKRKRSSWITPSAACNQRAGNVQRRFIKPIWVFRFRFDLPRRDLCPMLYRIDNIISVGGKKNIPPPRASSSSSSPLRINSLRWLCLRGILDFLRSR